MSALPGETRTPEIVSSVMQMQERSHVFCFGGGRAMIWGAYDGK